MFDSGKVFSYAHTDLSPERTKRLIHVYPVCYFRF